MPAYKNTNTWEHLAMKMPICDNPLIQKHLHVETPTYENAHIWKHPYMVVPPYTAGVSCTILYVGVTIWGHFHNWSCCMWVLPYVGVIICEHHHMCLPTLRSDVQLLLKLCPGSPIVSFVLKWIQRMKTMDPMRRRGKYKWEMGARSITWSFSEFSM